MSASIALSSSRLCTFVQLTAPIINYLVTNFVAQRNNYQQLSNSPLINLIKMSSEDLEKLRKASRQIDRQLYTMGSSRGFMSSSLQSKTTLEAYQRFFEETAARFSAEETLEQETQNRIEAQEKMEAEQKMRRKEMEKNVKECLDLQVSEKAAAKLKEKEAERVSESLPLHVVSVYPKILTKNKLSPVEEKKRVEGIVKKTLEEQIEKKNSLEIAAKVQEKEADMKIVTDELEAWKTEELEKKKKIKEAQAQYKSELGKQMEIQRLKYGSGKNGMQNYDTIQEEVSEDLISNYPVENEKVEQETESITLTHDETKTPISHKKAKSKKKKRQNSMFEILPAIPQQSPKAAVEKDAFKRFLCQLQENAKKEKQLLRQHLSGISQEKQEELKNYLVKKEKQKFLKEFLDIQKEITQDYLLTYTIQNYSQEKRKEEKRVKHAVPDIKAGKGHPRNEEPLRKIQLRETMKNYYKFWDEQIKLHEMKKNEEKTLDTKFFNDHVKPKADRTPTKKLKVLEAESWKEIREFERSVSQIKKLLNHEVKKSPKRCPSMIETTLKDLQSKVSELPMIRSPQRSSSLIGMQPEDDCETYNFVRRGSSIEFPSKTVDEKFMRSRGSCVSVLSKAKSVNTRSPIPMRKKIIYLSPQYQNIQQYYVKSYYTSHQVLLLLHSFLSPNVWLFSYTLQQLLYLVGTRIQSCYLPHTKIDRFLLNLLTASLSLLSSTLRVCAVGELLLISLQQAV
eukprot:TRINITY_DN2353_c0_g1_i11.p1 TRINITY_DN2353_c0_g1~~TRINITY_DN2353_c0_g1_i11.p1  ORF type:complete len:736 (-),score=102.24 TRINITY_DN2353_c0_g1_i11:6148-8355(-)